MSAKSGVEPKSSSIAERVPGDEAWLPGPAAPGGAVHLVRDLRAVGAGGAGLALLDHAHQRRRHGAAQIKDAAR